MTQWTNHFSSITTSQSHSNSAVVEVCNLTSLSKLYCDDIVDDDFTVEEVELALQKLKKQEGWMVSMQPEHLKYGGALLTLWLKAMPSSALHTFHPTF